ncbi:hypothetical protein SAMN05443247_07866 [Bradyrhizobium erythrophlei]|jgi:hypothetical protein|nr:hypothetical protein SAMN05443247_07866 [Bradyrhizobium erythrophlei]
MSALGVQSRHRAGNDDIVGDDGHHPIPACNETGVTLAPTLDGAFSVIR